MSTEAVLAFLKFLLDLGPELVQAFSKSGGDARKVVITSRVGEMERNQAEVDAEITRRIAPK